VYGLVRQWNGAITLWSRPGQGTTFRIYLPTVEGPPQSVARPPKPETTLHGSETVLLVEDETLVRGLLVRVLSDCGYRVLEARDGVEALAVASAHLEPIDLLVTDVVMPRMGGVALARRLRAVRPGLPVLFVSGHPEERTAGRTREVVSGNFLQKPCAPRDFLARVRETLDAARSARPA
jgi:DNA-binding response OmpR family regulator